MSHKLTDNVVIDAGKISKRYRLGLRQKSDSISGQIQDILFYPIRNFRRIAQLSKFNEANDPSVFWALKNIDFQVSKGEVLGIVGHNGAGKSTLLKILSRITEPSTGEITLTGKVSSLLEVGTGFHPELSGRDNVYMNGTILGMTRKEIDVKFDEIVSFSGIDKHLDTPVKFYSSGMKVRLAFSVAAHLEPEILIIDEVLAVGDHEFQKKCLGKMEDVAGHGRTIIFVSHDMMAIQNLCTRVMVLDNGKIGFDGDPEKAIAYYLDAGKTQSTFGIIDGGTHRNSYHKNKLKMNSIVLQNASGHQREVFGYLEPIVLKLNLSVKKEINNGSLFLSVGNKDFGKITFSSSWEEKKYLELPAGKSDLIAKLAPNLLPGVYTISIGILDPDGYPYEGIANFGSFEVLAEGAKVKYQYTRNLGIIRVPVSIECRKSVQD